MNNEAGNKFNRGSVDSFFFNIQQDLGQIQTVTVSMCDSCGDDGWKVDKIVVTNLVTMETYIFQRDGPVTIKPPTAVVFT